jgi:cytochrome bd-type quinol oxidase subunit 2
MYDFAMKRILLVCLSFVLLASASPAFADPDDPFGTKKATGIDATVKSDAHTSITLFLNYFLGFLGLLVVTMFIWSGVLFVTAQGDEKQLEKAKKIMLWSIVGVLIIMLSLSL